MDDDPGIRHGLETRLSGAGYRVHAVASGEEALAACSLIPPDVMILDVTMPGIDGYQVCQRLRATISQPVGVIFLTGTTYAGTSSCLEQLINESGGDYFLVKPYDAELLLSLVEQITREGLVSVR